MSYYEDERPRRRERERGPRVKDTYYAEDETYRAREEPNYRDNRQTSLVRRRDDSADSIEEIDRDFEPGNGGYVKETTVRKHGTRPVRARSFSGRDRYDDRYTDDRSTYIESRRGDGYASSKRSSRRGGDDRRDRRSRKYDSYSSSSSSRSPPRRRDRERRKSVVEETLGALGLGGAAAALLGQAKPRSRSRGGRDRDRGRDRSSSSERTRTTRRSYSRSDKRRGRSKSKPREQIIQSLKAAALAGATEAFRARNEPGGWGGAKGKRILTAAVGAAGVDGLITGTSNRNPDHHSKRHIIESAIGGLATNRIINGPRSKSRGRGRSPSATRNGAGDLAAGGLLAAGAKKLYDRARSKSRGRSLSSDSYDSRSPGRREKKRSKSLTDYARGGLAALGIGGAAKEAGDRRSRDIREHSEEDEYYQDRYNAPNGYADTREVGQPQPGLPPAVNGGSHIKDGFDYGPHHTGDPNTDSESDLGSSSDEEKERRKSSGKQLVTAGLATIATIHAAHSIYQSAEKHDEREKEWKKGEISSEQLKKARNRGLLQDAASVGIAALGIKGAYSEWMEAKEFREQRHERLEKFERHKVKRAARREKQLAQARAYQQSGYSESMPNLHTAGPGYYGGGAPYSATGAPAQYYADDNPYSAMAGQQYQQPQPQPQQQQQQAPLPRSDYMNTPPAWNGQPRPQ